MTNLYSTTTKVPLVIRFENSLKAVRNEIPQYFHVTFKGTGWKILSLYLKNAEWVVDLEREFESDNLKINTKKTASQYLNGLPDGLVIDDVTPAELDLILVDKSTKAVPIELTTDLEPSTGYTISPKIILTPDSVRVSGAKTWMDTLSYWPTKYGTIAHLNSSFNVNLKLHRPSQKSYTISHNEILLQGKAEQLAELEFADIPVKLSHQKGRDTIIFLPNRVNVIIGGGLGVLENIHRDSITVVVPFDRVIDDTSGRLKPMVSVPENTQLIRTIPQELEYIIRK